MLGSSIERINKIVEAYDDRLNFKKKKKPIKKKEIKRIEIQERADRVCIFPECSQKIPARGTSFCFDHNSFLVRKEILVSWGYAKKDAAFYSKVKSFPVFLDILKRKKTKCGN